ncbi:hypothetical protein [Lysobacter sp. Root690]|uniref:hypothetical protein n=1 Tax=Lysobacter sp. Root690 TaxID=1736588 RepID=UPI0006F1F53F|nr:hypothetical protein [Lysobacter sp. Root690]KRB03237.1 hypothetical protein ASD86_20305 [Lysobacter sp. Root690]
MTDPVHLLQEAVELERHILSGYEKPSEALTLETLRALDFAHCRELFPEFQLSDSSELQIESVRQWSINAALKRVFPIELSASEPEIPLSTETSAEHVDEFLLRMGWLSMAERQLSLLRSGALKGVVDGRKVQGMTLLVLSIQDPSAYREQVGYGGLKWLSDMVVAEDRPKEEILEQRYMQLLPRLKEYIRSSESPDELPFDDVDQYFHEWAVLYLRRMSFRDMLADDDCFGGRQFAQYVSVLEALSAMSQQRLCYSALMCANGTGTSVRNILTGGSSYDDLVESIASFLDAAKQEVIEILDHLMLSPDNAETHLGGDVLTFAPAVRTSSQLVLLPTYGLERNPFTFLWTELRRRYEKDWFEAANRREARWVSELRMQFPAPRWRCLDGVKLKREGKVLTDVDFAAHDTQSSSVILFQLKWQQPFLSDNKLRRNNASNLVRDSNKWISDIDSWVMEFGIDGLKERLSIKTGDLSVHLAVLGRYHAHFTLEEEHDARAVWCDWGNFLRQRRQYADASAKEFIDRLSESMEQAAAEVIPDSFFVPVGEVMLLINPQRVTRAEDGAG